MKLSNLRFASTRAMSEGSKLIVASLAEFVQRVDKGEIASMTHLDLSDNTLEGENSSFTFDAAFRAYQSCRV